MNRGYAAIQGRYLFILLLSYTLFACEEGTSSQTENQAAVPAIEDSLMSRPFQFQFEGRTYAGILDVPHGSEAKSLMVLVPGSGKTYMASGEWNYTLRTTLNQLGIATFAYDKAGCGDSEGEFDYNQTVENSGDELVAAVQALQTQQAPGSQNIGLWGISRAGWICPLAIAKEPAINYWISVSGPNHLDNMYHLLTTNWAIEGRSQEEVETLGKEWK
ncbi:MAG: alpha/beta hydrolase, partial [Bacteroidota bacterium]